MNIVTPIDICNLALGHLGDRRITRLDDEAARDDGLVRYCAEFYNQARTEVLEAQEWGFAKRTQELTRRNGVNPIGFNYAQILPEDQLRLISLHPGSISTTTGETRFRRGKLDLFEIVGMDVWTNEQLVAAKYIKDSTNPTEWSSHVRAAVGRLLASFLAGPLADDPRMVKSQKEIYESVDLPNAQYYDAVQDRSGENSDVYDRRSTSALIQSHGSSDGYYSDGTPFDSVESSSTITIPVPDLDAIIELGLP